MWAGARRHAGRVRSAGAGSRFVGVLALLTGVLLLAGLVTQMVLDRRLTATESIRERSVAALIAAERLRAGLAGADATAASNVFAWVTLAPSSLSPAERRSVYDRVKADDFYAGDHSGDVSAGIAGDLTGDAAPGGAGDGAAGADPAAAANPYSAALRGAETALLDLREIDPGACDPVRDPGSTHCVMTRIATLIPEYTGLVAAAVANTRPGNPVGGAYQNLASDLMTRSILGQTDQLVAAYGDRVDRDYRQATSGAAEGALLGALGGALVALVGAQVYVFRRTNRMLNLGLVTATVLVVGAGSAGLVLLHGQGERLATAQRSDYVPTTLLAASRTLALQARTCEFLSLISLGNGENADRCFADAVSALGYTPDGQPKGPSSGGTLTAGLTALPDRFAGQRAELAGDLGSWLQVRARAVATLQEPPPTAPAGDSTGAAGPTAFGRAIKDTLASPHFERFVGGTDELLAQGTDSFAAELRGAARDVRLLTGIVVVAAVLAVLCAGLGIGSRIREYR
ncbi:hypothetical protein CC117_18695 [Parafrankia colletiae]|uniref:Uncharacterized protein n=1 Tax=Parafrankia colletiae TaxID=573497 RepID=A0A1S1QSH9_9ACTN|nr:hypothetical protein CC117_18695 [Parafrankia colletiae]